MPDALFNIGIGNNIGNNFTIGESAAVRSDPDKPVHAELSCVEWAHMITRMGHERW